MGRFNVELKFENEVQTFYSFDDFSKYLEDVHGIDYIVLIDEEEPLSTKKDNKLYKEGYSVGYEIGYDKGFDAGFYTSESDTYNGDDYSW